MATTSTKVFGTTQAPVWHANTQVSIDARVPGSGLQRVQERAGSIPALGANVNARESATRKLPLRPRPGSQHSQPAYVAHRVQQE